MKFHASLCLGAILLATGCGMQPSNPNGVNPSTGTPHTANMPIDQTGSQGNRTGGPGATDQAQPAQPGNTAGSPATTPATPGAQNK
jgi:hypothetical protein